MLHQPRLGRRQALLTLLGAGATIDPFAALFPLNARPVQPLNSRFLLESL